MASAGIADGGDARAVDLPISPDVGGRHKPEPDDADLDHGWLLVVGEVSLLTMALQRAPGRLRRDWGVMDASDIQAFDELAGHPHIGHALPAGFAFDAARPAKLRRFQDAKEFSPIDLA